MQLRNATSLWESFRDSGVKRDAWLRAGDSSINLSELASGSVLGTDLEELRGRSILVSTSDQLAAALALIEIDGVARRLVLCPPDLDRAHLPYVARTAEIEAIVTDHGADAFRATGVDRVVSCARPLRQSRLDRTPSENTEWVLFTSGTTGLPKMVVHTLSTLTGAIGPARPDAGPVTWATFYDVRRYGGLQILLRAVTGGSSLLMSSRETLPGFLKGTADYEVTHITGTPSHWRRALMSATTPVASPKYLRLSGEIVDQAILDQLRSRFPDAEIVHAFASTEAGVAFEVTDGLAGFPASLVGRDDSDVALEVREETLRIRSPRTALGYVGNTDDTLLDADGFVDTGDVVDRRGERYYFIGRRGGIINVGGLKVHPEEVEAVINEHPAVRMSLVSARKNPITGAIVTATVVLSVSASEARDPDLLQHMRTEILANCRASLAPHKVPASIEFVTSLPVAPSGKLRRRDASHPDAGITA